MYQLLLIITSALTRHSDKLYPYKSACNLQDIYKKGGKEIGSNYYECVLVDGTTKEIYYLAIHLGLEEKIASEIRAFQRKKLKKDEEIECKGFNNLVIDLINLSSNEQIYDVEPSIPKTILKIYGKENFHYNETNEVSFHIKSVVDDYELKLYFESKDDYFYPCYYNTSGKNNVSTKDMIFMKKLTENENPLLEEMRNFSKNQKENNKEKILNNFKEKYGKAFQIEFSNKFPVYLEIKKNGVPLEGLLKGEERLAKNLKDETEEKNGFREQEKKQREFFQELNGLENDFLHKSAEDIIYELEENIRNKNYDQINRIEKFIENSANKQYIDETRSKLAQLRTEGKVEGGEWACYGLTPKNIAMLLKGYRESGNFKEAGEIQEFLDKTYHLQNNVNYALRYIEAEERIKKALDEEKRRQEMINSRPNNQNMNSVNQENYSQFNQYNTIAPQDARKKVDINQDGYKNSEDDDDKEEDEDDDEDEEEDSNTFLKIVIWVLLPIILIILFFIIKDKKEKKKSGDENDIEIKEQLVEKEPQEEI